jgi:predicted MPP superfamily phosphohydrolase
MGAAHIRSAAEIFRPLAQDRAAHGVIAVLGNHDHYGDGPAMAAALRGVGVRTIDNDRLFLAAASRRLQDLPVAEGLCLSGVGDLWEDVVDEARALRDVPPEVPRIMLAHNPDSAELIASRSGGRPPRVDLMICGHMHGGQVSLPLVGVIAVPSRFGLKYAHGLVTSPLGPVIVSAGVGMSFVPVRLGVRPEIVEITLVRA